MVWYFELVDQSIAVEPIYAVIQDEMAMSASRVGYRVTTGPGLGLRWDLEASCIVLASSP